MLTPTSPTPDANPELSGLSLPSGSQVKKASYMLPENPGYQRVQYSIEGILQPNENRRGKKGKDQIPDSSFYAILDHAGVRRRANDGSYTPDEQERIIQAARDLASPAEKPSKFSLWLRKQFNATVLALSGGAAAPAMAAPTVDLYGRTISQTSQDTNKFLSGMSGSGASTGAMNLPLTAIQINLGEGTTANLGYEYQSLLGSVLSGGLVTQFGEDGAISVNVKVSKDMYNILTQAGYKVTEGVDAKITFSHISEKMNFDFASGSTTTRVPLNTFGATVRFTPQAFAKFVEITGYKINAKSFTLGQRDYIVETADVIQFWTDSRRVTGNSTRGAEIKANFPLFSDNPRANFTLGAGYQLSKWDTLIPTPETGGVTWNFRGNIPVSRTTDIHFEGSHQASFNRYGIGLSMQNGIFAEMFRELPTNVGKAQNTYRIGVNIALDGRPTSQSTSPFFNDRQNIRDFTSSQPTYVPNRASYNYKIDPTNLPFLSVSINKNDLPNNVEIDKKNAIMNITLDNPGTLESAINTSSNPLQDVSPAFQLNGNTLVFRPGTINPNTLADGQNTILVTTSEGYIVNITVQKGSVEVVGVTITKKSKDAPTNVGTTQIVSVTSDSFVLKHNISDPDGVRNLVCQQVDATGKSVGNPVSMNSNGTCTIVSLLPDTRYNYIVTGEALDKSTNTWKSVSASSIIVNTLQAPDVPPVANPDSYSVTVGQNITLNPLANDTATNGATLTLVSITQPQFGTLQKSSDGTYVYTGITAGEEKISYKVQTKPGISATGEITIKIDAKDQPGTIAAPVLSSSTSSSLSLVSGTVTGMTNVEFVLYSDMALTQEVARNSTGIFTGLSSGTTYYARTQALDPNENTGVSEVKKSPYIAVITNVLDTPDVFTPPTLTIGTNGVTFAGGSVSDPDNTEKGYTPTITYTVRDSAGNIVSNYATGLSPDTAYTYTAKYMTWDRATNTLVLKEIPPVSFKTNVLLDTTAPSQTSPLNLGTFTLGNPLIQPVQFDEAIGTAKVSGLPTGVTATTNINGSSVQVTLNVDPKAFIFSSATQDIPFTLTVTDRVGNARPHNESASVNDVAPEFPIQLDAIRGDDTGAIPIVPVPNICPTGKDQFGRSITCNATVNFVSGGISAGGLNYNNTSNSVEGTIDVYVDPTIFKIQRIIRAINGAAQKAIDSLLTINDQG